MESYKIASDTIPDWGVDTMDVRPGVPREHPPAPVAGAHWSAPEPQPSASGAIRAISVMNRTPVVGTAQPVRGLSGLIRRAAYAVPEHKVRHWLMLLMADRVDVAEHNLARVAPWLGLLVPAAGAAAWLVLRPRRSRWRRALAF